MAGWNPNPLLITGLLLGLSLPAVAAPFVEEVDPPVLRRGTVTQITLRGRDLHQAEGVWLSLPNARAIGFVAGSSPDEATLEVSVPSEAPLGMCGLRLATKSGLSNVHIVLIDELPITRAAMQTNSKPLAVSLPCCVSAPCRPASVDRYSIKVSAGQTVSFEAIGSRFGKNHDPLVTIRDIRGRILAQRDNDPGLFKRRESASRYTRIRVRDGTDDPCDARADQRFGAGRCLAVVRAGLERHVGGRTLRLVTGGLQGDDLGVRLTRALVPPFADHRRIADQHAAHHRVGRGVPEPAPRQPGRHLQILGVAPHASLTSGSTTSRPSCSRASRIQRLASVP